MAAADSDGERPSPSAGYEPCSRLPQHEKRTQARVCVHTRVSVHTDGCLQACEFACVCIHKCLPVGTRGLGARVSKDMV